MIWHEIVKYSPENYDENGVYTKNEWISRSDIGTSYEGKSKSSAKSSIIHSAEANCSRVPLP